MTDPNSIGKVALRAVSTEVGKRYGMDGEGFEQVVFETCCDDKLSLAEFAAFLLVAKEYRLNPITREIFAFKKKGGGIVPIVSVDGWISLVNSHAAFDGMQFCEAHNEKRELISTTCRLFRKDRSHPIEVTEYLSECKRETDPWKMQHRMLRHKSLIQCARYAFGFSGIYDEEEGAAIAMRDITPQDEPPEPPAVPPAPSSEPRGTGPAAGVEHREPTGSGVAPCDSSAGNNSGPEGSPESSVSLTDEAGRDAPQTMTSPPHEPFPEIPAELERRPDRLRARSGASYDPRHEVEEAEVIETEPFTEEQFEAFLADLEGRYASASDRASIEEIRAEVEAQRDRIFPADYPRVVGPYARAINRS